MQEIYMKKALAQAKKAFNQDEVPIGAVIVYQGDIIASAHNTRQGKRDATCHAEITAIKKACSKIGDWRLNGCEMYVTLEPCAMCVGACINARIDKLYFGAYESKAGCCGSVVDLPQVFHPNHTMEVCGGILQEECSTLLKTYFNGKRTKSKE